MSRARRAPALSAMAALAFGFQLADERTERFGDHLATVPGGVLVSQRRPSRATYVPHAKVTSGQSRYLADRSTRLACTDVSAGHPSWCATDLPSWS